MNTEPPSSNTGPPLSLPRDGRDVKGLSRLPIRRAKWVNCDLCLSFLAIMADGIHQRLVIHDEKNRRIFGGIFVMMEVPERCDEGVALFPFITLVADIADAAAAVHIVNRRAGVPVAFGFLAGAQHVNLT